MVVKFAKWGNSIAVRIPAPILEQISAQEGTCAELTVRDGALVVAPVQQPLFDLDDLISRISDENRHGEIASARAIGNEFA